MRLALVVSAAVLWLVVAADLAMAQTMLRYRFKEGETQEYVAEHHQKSTMLLKGNKVEATITAVTEFTWQTLGVGPQDRGKVKVTIGRVKMAVDSQLTKVMVDSEDTKVPDDLTGKALHRSVQMLASTEISFAIDGLGNIQDAKFSESTVKRLQKLLGADKSRDMPAPAAMRSLVEVDLLLPKEAVAKGKSWAQKTSIQGHFGKLSGTTTYTFDGTVERNGKQYAKIALAPDLKVESGADPKPAFTFKNVKSKGYVLFDIEAGHITKMRMETTMQQDQNVGGMISTQDIERIFVLQLKKQYPAPGGAK